MKLFDKVKCKGFYSKVHDGTFIYLDTQNLKASHMNSNATDTECLVEDDVDRAEKTYYKHVKQNFCGVIVGFTDLIVIGYLDVIYNDAIDVGVGILPEQFFVQKNPNHVEKCAIVYYANNKKHYVPLEDIECENSDERNNNHD